MRHDNFYAAMLGLIAIAVIGYIVFWLMAFFTPDIRKQKLTAWIVVFVGIIVIFYKFTTLLN